METKTRERKKSGLLPGLVPAALTGLYFAVTWSRPIANAVTRWFSRPVKAAMGTVFALLPFSVMELEYLAAGAGLIVFVVLSVRAVARVEKKLAALARRLWLLCVWVLCIFTVYLWIFGVDYRSDTFVQRSGLADRPVSSDELYETAEYFIKNAAAAAGDVSRDGDGHWAEDIDSYLPRSKELYVNLSGEFPFLGAASRVPKKMYLFSRLSSWMGFTGVYFPFSGESNINIDAPGCLIPCTVGHELAHQHGVFREDEANFVGIAACLSSGDPVYTYSAWLDGAIHLGNALYEADPELWRQVSTLITGDMRVDWIDNSEYWRSFEGPVGDVSEAVYDRFLTSQGQELGIRSYGACVDLLVAYYLEDARAAG